MSKNAQSLEITIFSALKESLGELIHKEFTVGL